MSKETFWRDNNESILKMLYPNFSNNCYTCEQSSSCGNKTLINKNEYNYAIIQLSDDVIRVRVDSYQFRYNNSMIQIITGNDVVYLVATQNCTLYYKED